MTDWSVEVHRCGEHPAAENAYYAPEVGAWLCNVCGGFCDRLECVVVRRHAAPPMELPEPEVVTSLEDFRERFGELGAVGQFRSEKADWPDPPPRPQSRWDDGVPTDLDTAPLDSLPPTGPA